MHSELRFQNGKCLLIKRFFHYLYSKNEYMKGKNACIVKALLLLAGARPLNGAADFRPCISVAINANT